MGGSRTVPSRERRTALPSARPTAKPVPSGRDATLRAASATRRTLLSAGSASHTADPSSATAMASPFVDMARPESRRPGTCSPALSGMLPAWAPSRDQLRKPVFDSAATIRLPLPATATSGALSRGSAALQARPRCSVITPRSFDPSAATVAPSADTATKPRWPRVAGLDPANELSLLGEEVDPAAALRRHDHVVFRARRRGAETVVLESDGLGQRLAVQRPQRDPVAAQVKRPRVRPPGPRTGPPMQQDRRRRWRRAISGGP